MKYEKREITFRVMYSDGELPFLFDQKEITNVHPHACGKRGCTFVVKDGDEENDERCASFFTIEHQ